MPLEPACLLLLHFGLAGRGFARVCGRGQVRRPHIACCRC